MPSLTAARIEQIRDRLWARQDAALTDHVEWWPVAKAEDGSSGYLQRWPSKSATYACAVLDRPAAIIGDDFIEAASNAPSHTVVLSRSATQPRPADRFYWVERAQWLEVKQRQPPGTNGPARRIECIEITP